MSNNLMAMFHQLQVVTYIHKYTHEDVM